MDNEEICLEQFLNLGSEIGKEEIIKMLFERWQRELYLRKMKEKNDNKNVEEVEEKFTLIQKLERLQNENWELIMKTNKLKEDMEKKEISYKKRN